MHIIITLLQANQKNLEYNKEINYIKENKNVINSYFLIRTMEVIKYWNNIQIVKEKKPVFQEGYLKVFFRIKVQRHF